MHEDWSQQHVIASVAAVTRIPRDVSVQLFRRRPASLEFLMLRRTPQRGGFWQGVTGAPRVGESDAEAAAREVLEETGFDVRETLTPLDVSYAYSFSGMAADLRKLYGEGVTTVSVVCFGAEVPGATDPVLDPAEHDAFAWCDYGLARRRLDWPIERDALPGRLRSLEVLAAKAGQVTDGPLNGAQCRLSRKGAAPDSPGPAQSRSSPTG